MLILLRRISLLTTLMSVIFNIPILGILSAIVYLVNLIKEKDILINYFYIIFLILTNILGVYVIEYSSMIYLYEIEQKSFNAGALAPILFVHLIFIETLLIAHKYKKTNFKNISKVFSANTINLVTLVVTVVITLLFIKVLNKPYFNLGYDRFAYQKNILSDLEIKIGNLLFYFTPLFYISYKSNKKLGIIALILFNLYFIWIGHKFSIFIMGFQLGVLFITNYLNSKDLNKYLIRIGLIIIFLFTAVSVQNFLIRDANFNENTNYFKSRLAQQGQLWWGIYKNEESSKLHLNEASKELNLFFTPGAESSIERFDLGMYKVMKIVAPPERVEFKINQGSRYSYSTQANLLYYFNYPILIVFTILMAYILYLITNLLIKSLIQWNFINIVLFSKLYINYIRFLTNGDFYTIFSLETIFILIGATFVNVYIWLKDSKVNVPNYS
jgi:hypothetical protein